jgi:CubicO group peptidase (beta-lactamase class C family)
VSSIGNLEPFIHEQMERWNVPGVSIGIFDGDDVEFAGFGITNIETGQPVAPETLFQIGSISKIFTATLAMTLVDDGLLDLDAPVVTYVPELVLADPAARAQITIRHLLNHRAGFYGDRFDDQGAGDDALKKAILALRDLPQQSAVGELYTYCNAGFDLVGRAIENVLGQTFDSAMRERVFDPLGLERTTYFASEAIRHSVAVGHEVGGEDGQTVAEPWPIPRRSNPAGGIISNVPELIRFVVMHLRDGAIGEQRVISIEIAREMRRPMVQADYGNQRGLAWVVRSIGDLTVVEHGGGTNGFLSRLILIPEKRYAIAVMTNGEYGSTLHAAVTAKAIERRFGATAAAPTRVTLPEDGLRRFTGSFKHGLADATITLDGDRLSMARTSHNPFNDDTRELGSFQLSPLSETLFIVDDGSLEGSIGELILDDAGAVRFLRFSGRLGMPVTGPES